MNDKYNRAVVYIVKSGEQPDVSYHGVESKDLVLSPEEAVLPVSYTHLDVYKRQS